MRGSEIDEEPFFLPGSIIGNQKSFTSADAGRFLNILDARTFGSQEVVMSIIPIVGTLGVAAIKWGAGGSQFLEQLPTGFYANSGPIVIPLRGSWFRLDVRANAASIIGAHLALGTCPRYVYSSVQGTVAAGLTAVANRVSSGLGNEVMPASAVRVKIQRSNAPSSPITIADNAGQNLMSLAAGEQMEWLDIQYAQGLVITNDDIVGTDMLLQFELGT